MERQHIIRALNLLNGNKTDVAAKLGISRATLWRKLKEHKIELGEPEI
jgi:two-component system nitrogen regulation response regulator GlnG/two-component system response regulator HydG